MAHRAPILLDHFRDQLQKHPSSIAIEDGTKSSDQKTWERITYAQLDALSERWSKHLRLAGIGAGCVVPLLSNRSIAMVAATLAILKLRAAYVPMDTCSWGQDRIEIVLRTVSPKLIVTTSACRQDQYPYPVLVLHPGDSGEPGEIAACNGSHCTREDEGFDGRGNDLAYIIFTSGTTGKPKGVQIGQTSISRYVKEGGDLPFNFNTKHGTRVLLICSIAFDVCVGVMFSTLCNGGTLVLADPPTLEVAARTCHVLPLTPSILVTLNPGAGFDTVEGIFLGGENPSPSLIEAWSSPRRRIYNSYGPTETTCTALMGELKPGLLVTVGFPISYSTVILLDESGRESKEGEIYISGLGLAWGYFHDPDRTKGAFVRRREAMIYKTGDYGKWTKEGLQFCGRRDSVVKNRGFLINLEADVEPALQSFVKVNRALAFMSHGRLIAFVTPASAKKGLRDYLASTVSSFLIPDTIYSLDEFPMTGNGKVDRKSLLRMHELEQSSDTASLESGLGPVEAVRRGFSIVLQLPTSRILQISSFRQLGGHSLTAVMLASVLRRMGFGISVARVLLLDTVESMAAAVETLADDAHAFFAPEDATERLMHEMTTTLPLEGATLAPMADIQTRMLSGSVATPGLSFIKTSFTFNHPGKQNLTSILHDSWLRLCRRHEILRTSFVLSVSNGVQVIAKEPGVSWKEEIVIESEWDSVCRRKEFLAGEDFGDFDAEDQASLSRVVLVVAPSKRTRFIWTVHHSLIDGWSMAILMRDFAICLENRTIPAPPQFAQVVQEIDRLKIEFSDKAVSFWKGYLGGYTPVPRLRVSPPTDVSDYTQASVSRRMTISVSELEAAAKDRFQVSPATLLYAAWGLLISRYSGTDRAVLGAVLSGRNLQIPGIENIVGPLINVLPLAIDTQEDQSTHNFVQSVFRRLCDVLEFQWSPAALIQDGSGCNPAELFETLFASQYGFPESPWDSLAVPQPRDISYCEATQVPLTVLLNSAEGRFNVHFIYRRSYFSNAVIQRMISQLDNLLTALTSADLEMELRKIAGKMLEEDRQHGISNVKPIQLDSSREVPQNLVEAIENSIQAHPDKYAVEASTGSLTYREFGRLTDHIAEYIVRHNGRASAVCVVSDGSLLWLLAMIATIRAGAIYCPIDEKLPRVRKDYMIQNSGATLVLFTKSSKEPVCGGITFLVMESIVESIFSASALATPANRNHPIGDDVACLIFTSGSTGLPKGQRNAQMLSLGFDCCIKEVFSTICFGATLVLKDPENPIAHLTRVDATMATPSLLATLEPDDYPNLKVITVVGEAMSQVLNDKWASGRTLINGYGPAECTLISTTAILRVGSKVSIVPKGLSGEIYISGVQVTPGYLHDEQETARRYLGDPLSPAQRMFRTGDIGRELEDGNIEYIGREDDQIKLRGFRLDLGEVQSTISKLATDARNVALIVSNGNLVAFMTPENIDIESLTKSLELHLPRYAVPHRIIALAKLPTSVNNKVDLSALRAYVKDRGTTGVAVDEPETDTQQTLADIWANVLRRDLKQMPIGPSDRFFELGGHSLLQIKVAQAISKHWNIRPLPLKHVIRHHSLRDLSFAIDELVNDSTSRMSTTPFLQTSPVPRDGLLPLSYLETEMLLNHLISAGSPAGNMNFVCSVRGNINAGVLAEAFQSVTANIEVFRTRYSVVDGILCRQQAPATVHIPCVVQTGNLNSFIHQKITRSFELSTEPPLDVSIIIGDPVQIILVVIMSHVVGDAVTMATYLNRVCQTYHLLTSNVSKVKLTTTPDALTYIDWAQWASAVEHNPRALAFWSSYLSNPPSPLTFGKPSPGALTYVGSIRSWTLSTSMHHRLSKLAEKSAITMHQLMLGAVFISLQCIDRRDDILLAAPVMHRSEPGTESIPGLFLDRLLVRIQHLSGQSSLFSFLSSIRETSQQALAHIIPYQSLRSHLAHKPSLINPLFQVMVAYHIAAQQQPLLELHGAEVQPIPCRGTGGSKFPLKVELTETVVEDLQVDMEYDMGCISEDIAIRLEFALSFTLQLMVTERDVGDIIQLVEMSFRPGTEHGQEESVSRQTNGENKTDALIGETGLHMSVVNAVSECLRLEAEAIDPMKSFWDLGGQSMDALKLQHLCEKQGVRLGLRDIFTSQSILELSACAGTI
ncbi:nonribosomal peptide synthase 2 [Fusarium heterosporum]|uniref:Nonribosomal peptide synthase 2 n=1 Tax=Fusarium heterosporum TaxID=42747 RepID=A0A8H5WGI9_FUSHE|nr:nonribosomal peptide synthase 2 [Fusarium heterosporum]